MQPKIASTLDIDRTVFAPLLKRAIKKRGLSYQRAAELVRDRLPPSSKLSHVSIWHYASAQTTPRRLDVFEALCDVFDIDYKLGQRAARDLDPASFSKLKASETLSSSGLDGRFFLKNAGHGIAFVRLEAEIDLEKALRIAEILREGGGDSRIAAQAT